MSFNSFGRVFRFTTWGESHGPALGAVVDGCPPGLGLSEGDIQPFLDRRRPGQSRFTTQRQEPDQVRILSGVFQGRTTGTPIALHIDNVDQRSKDYSEVAKAYRPGHADYAYDQKYGFRDYRGGGRSSARETAARVAAGAVARLVIPEVTITAWVEAIGGDAIDYAKFDAAEIANNPFFCPDPDAAARWETLVDAARKDGSSLGARIRRLLAPDAAGARVRPAAGVGFLVLASGILAWALQVHHHAHLHLADHLGEHCDVSPELAVALVSVALDLFWCRVIAMLLHSRGILCPPRAA